MRPTPHLPRNRGPPKPRPLIAIRESRQPSSLRPLLILFAATPRCTIETRRAHEASQWNRATRARRSGHSAGGAVSPWPIACAMLCRGEGIAHHIGQAHSARIPNAPYSPRRPRNRLPLPATPPHSHPGIAPASLIAPVAYPVRHHAALNHRNPPRTWSVTKEDGYPPKARQIKCGEAQSRRGRPPA